MLGSASSLTEYNKKSALAFYFQKYSKHLALRLFIGFTLTTNAG